MKQEKFTMAVTADHFSLYEAFKTEAEKLGWTYHSDFVPFSKTRIGLCNCMYFSFDFGNMEGRPAFSLSSTNEKTFQLESQFGEALEMAKQIIESYSIKTIKLNDLFLADIDPKEKTVTVYEEQFGYPLGERFSFDKIRELTDLINELELLEMDRFVNKTKKKC
jgi:hypothetical protein